MINVHQRLTDAFNTMPNIGVTDTFSGFKSNYSWGNQDHLNKIIKLAYNDPDSPPYPLIYNVTNRYDYDEKKKIASTSNLALIIATRNENVDLTNTQRWATSYKNILFPTVDYILQCFAKSGIFVWDKSYRLYEFPNYGENDENKTIDIWDALRLETNIIINDNCIKSILYDTN